MTSQLCPTPAVTVSTAALLQASQPPPPGSAVMAAGGVEGGDAFLGHHTSSPLATQTIA